MFAAVVVLAGESTPTYFDIRAQSMEAALIEFSEQANIQLMISSELVKDLHSSGVRGRYLPADALAVLIAGTGLTFHMAANETIAIVRVDGT